MSSPHDDRSSTVPPTRWGQGPARALLDRVVGRVHRRTPGDERVVHIAPARPAPPGGSAPGPAERVLTAVAGWGVAPRVAVSFGAFAASCALEMVAPADALVGCCDAVAVAATTWLLGETAGLLIAVLSGVCALVAARLASDNAAGLAQVLWGPGLRAVVLSLVVGALRSVHDAYDRQVKLAERDPLTGLLNRRGFRARAESERRLAHETRPLSVVLLEVEGVAVVHRNEGRLAVDHLLERVAAIFEGRREVAAAARVGGGTFALLLPGVDEDAAAWAVDRVRIAVELGLVDGRDELTLAAGVITYEEPPPGVDALLAAADELLSRARRAGRGQTRSRLVTHRRNATVIALRPKGGTR